jgi:hypothetical protein
MKARFIFEKFTEDDDPIQSMGIGMKTKVDQLRKEYRKDYWDRPSLRDLIEFYLDEKPGKFEDKKSLLDYMVSRAKGLRNDYEVSNLLQGALYQKDENEVIKYLDFYKNKKFLLKSKYFDLLNKALRNKYYKVAQYALNNGYDINHDNDIVLSDAFISGDITRIKWLLARGAKLRVRDRKCRIFKAAVRIGNEELMTMCAKAYLGRK